MIQKYVYGNPLETEAVVQPVSEQEGAPAHLTVAKASPLRFTYTLGEEDIVYGLGEAVRGINKRGFRYISNCTDDALHTEDKQSLYGAHNFLLIDGRECFGLFVDFPGSITFDIAFTAYDTLSIEPSYSDLTLYIIEGSSPLSIVKQFRALIGRSYIPPRWAFGYQQSRWGYKNEADITAVADGYQKNRLPLDAIYLDIDYMDHYKDFTVDPERFPDFKEFTAKMRERHLHLVPIIDAGVKIEDGYDVYEEGIRHGYFCKREDGTEFAAAVWPGRTHFPDVLNKEARAWFGSKYEALISQGIEGFWNDMNEPAIFYSDEGRTELMETLASYDEAHDKGFGLWGLKDAALSLSNNPKDYARFYHNIDGKQVRHDRVHNLFGYNMTRGAAEGFEAICPEKRLLLFSRASYIGMHRYGGIWTGDNISWWSHLLLHIKMMPSLNMCGFLYTGADLGGFGGHTTRDLLLRWLAFGVFTPLMRNHAALGTREQEVYQFERLSDFRGILELRYRLLPYLYSEFVKAALSDSLYFSPLAFLYPEDALAKRVEDQLFVGESIMIAPVYEQNARGRYVYLPEEMRFLRFSSSTEYTEAVLPAGHHYIEVALNEVPVFLRKNRLLPLAAPAQNSETLDTASLTVFAFGEGTLSYTLYEDDGYGKDFSNPAHYKTISVACTQDGMTAAETAGKEIIPA